MAGNIPIGFGSICIYVYIRENRKVKIISNVNIASIDKGSKRLNNDTVENGKLL